MIEKMILIINPTSGKRKGIKYADKLKKYFISNGVDAEYIFTRSIEHAKNIAETCSENYSYIGVCGGDGTLNAVLNGCVNKKVTLFFIPMGTVNIFAKEFKIPKNPLKAAKKLLSGKEAMLDVLKSKNKYALLMESVGIDSFTVNKITQDKIKAGKIKYVIETIKNLFTYNYPEVEAIINGKTHKGKFIFAGQCRNYAGFIRFTPDARLNDGVISVCLCKKGGLWGTLKFFISVLLGLHKNSKNVELLKTREIIFNGPPDLISQIDGEAYVPLPHKIELIPNKIRFLLPAKTSV